MFSVFCCYEIIKIFSPGSSLNLYMKLNINNEYVCNSSSQKFCNQNQCHYHKLLHLQYFLSLHRHCHSRFHYFHCLITALLLGETRHLPIGYHHYNTSSDLINSETLQWKLYNSILPHICYCIYSFRIKVKNTFARWKSCHVNYFVLFLSLLLKYSIMSLIYWFQFCARVGNKLDDNDDTIPRFMKHLSNFSYFLTNFQHISFSFLKKEETVILCEGMHSN